MKPRSTAGVRSTLLLFALSAAPALCSAAPAPEQALAGADALRVLHTVDQHYNHLSSLQCAFEEHYVGVGAERTEAGTLLLSKPGRMRWTYSTPPGKLFVLDGQYAWFYSPVSAQVQRTPAKQLDDLRSPLRFLLGRTRLERELGDVTVHPEANGFRILGIPRGMEQRVTSLRLDVEANGLINAIRVEERDGSVTEFRFHDATENMAVPADSFRFHAPEGVPVVNAMPPI